MVHPGIHGWQENWSAFDEDRDRKKAQLQLDKILGKRSRGEIIRYMVEANLLPRLGKLRLAQCDVHRLRRYRQERRKEGDDDTTCNRELSYLRAAWRRALKEGHVQHIPYFPTVKEDNARQGFIEEPDFLRFLSELPEALEAFAVLAYYGGMRRCEILELLITDIDGRNRYVQVRAEIAKNGEARLIPILEGEMVKRKKH